MPKLVFRVDADTSPVKKFRTEIEQIEKTMIRIKGENFSFDHWLREFDRLKTELEKKKEQIANIKKELLSINPISNPKATSSLEKEYAQAKKDQESLVHETVTLSNKFGKAYDDLVATLEKAQEVTDGVTAKLIEQKNAVSNLQSEVRILNAEYRNADKDKKAEILTQKTSKTKELEQERITLNALRAEQERAKLSVKSLSDETRNYEKVIGKVSGAQAEANLVMSRFEGTLLKIGGLATLQRFASDVIRIRGEFQKTQVAFETMLGSKVKADALMSQMVQTAAKTPFDLQGVADGAKQLLAYGTSAENVNDTLVRLGNIASGLSIPLGDMVYLYGTTQTQGRLFTQDVRQFMGRGIPLVKELAAELGKTEQEINKMVTAGEIGFPEVEKVIRKMTDEGGQFYNLMEKQSQTLSGQISNLGDAWDGMLNKIGTQTQEITSIGISAATSLIENYEEVIAVLGSLVISYGTYRAALIVVNTLEKANMLLLRQAVIEKKLAAAANITLSNSMAIAAARGKLFAVVQKNIISSFKGIGRTLTNPYVLFGAAIGAASYALFKFYTRETEVEQMQRQYNETKEAAAKREEEHKTKVDELINSIDNETTAEISRIGALETLKTLYPGIIEKYIDEEGHLRNLIALKKELAEFDATKKVEQNKTDLQSYDERIKNQEEYIDRMRTNDQSAFDDEVAKLDELKRQREIARSNVAADYISQSIKTANSMSDEEITNTINAYQKALSENKNGEWFDSGKEFKVEDINRYISALKNLQTTRANAVHDKEHWTNQKKEAETALNSIASSQKKLLDAGNFKGIDATVVKNYKDNVKKLNEAEKELKVYDTSSKQESESEKLRKQQEKSSEELLSLRRQNQQAEISLMKEGTEQKLKQIELDYQKETDAIKKQEKEWSKENNGKLTDEQSVQISLAYTGAEDKKDKGVEEVINETQKEEAERLKAAQQAWNVFYKEYGTFQEKRLAIAKEYKQKISEVQNDESKSDDEKNAFIATLQKEWDEATAGLNFDKLKTEINWEVVFGDVSKITKKQLQEVKKQLAEFKKSPEFKNATPEQIKVIEEAVNNINNALVDKGGFFGGLGESLDEYKQRVEEAKIAQEEYDKALKTGNDALIEKATTNKNAANKKLNNAQTNVEKSKDKAVSNINAVSNAIVQLGKENISLTDIGNTVGALVDTLGQSGSKIGGIISAILSVIDAAGEVGTFQYGLDIIENVSSTVTDAFARDTEAMTGLDMSFMRGADYDDYNEMVAKYDTLLDVWDQLLDKKKAYIKESYGIEATKAGQEALDLLNSERKITRELASSRLDAGASAGSHSMNYRMWKGSYDYEGTKWKDVAGQISKALGGVDFSSMWSMLDMSSEQLEWIKTNYSGLWASMDGDFRGYLDDIIQYGDTEKEIIKSINEQLTQTSFDSIFDSFVNTLMDMDASSKDFADSFEEYMRKAIFTSMFAKNYESALEEWYDAFAEANKKKEGITEDDVRNLKNRWDGIVNSALSDRETWEKIVGSSDSESSREASQKGIATASQDSVDENNGRLAVMQEHTYSINENVNRMAAGIDTIVSHTVNLSCLTNIDKTMQSILSMRDASLTHLSNIDNHTARLEAVEASLASIKIGIDTLNTKGITLKR